MIMNMSRRLELVIATLSTGSVTSTSSPVISVTTTVSDPSSFPSSPPGFSAHTAAAIMTTATKAATNAVIFLSKMVPPFSGATSGLPDSPWNDWRVINFGIPKIIGR